MKTRFPAFALLLACAAARAAEPAGSADPNENARILAGLPPSPNSPLVAITRATSWQEHAKFFDAAWASLEKRQLTKIRTWTAVNLRAPKATCYYLFSGPDYLYANAFYPSASTYILCGLEPVGHIPDATKTTNLIAALQGLEKSLNDMLNFSFFKTKEMREELRSNQFDGTIPILFVFLARSGKTIQEVSFVGIDKGGNEVADSGKGGTPGVKIVFKSAGGARQTLYYFTTDLSNEGVAHSGFLKFCERFGAGDSLVKSASYLLHSDGFSTARRFLLDQSATLAQDDSGIPIGYFDGTKWKVEPFGKYLGPIELFKQYYQPKMKELFDTGHPPPLEFGIGYRWSPTQSNWIVATRK